MQSGSSNNGGVSVPDYLVDLLERSSVHLDGEQVKVLQNLLLEYKDVFSKSSDDIGRTDLTEHRINTGTAFPIRQPGRRIPIGKREMEREELQKMIERGIVEPSNSPWASNEGLKCSTGGQKGWQSQILC